MRKCGLARYVLTVIAFAAAFISGSPALSQATNTGTVIGQVTDPSGAVIPGASVTLVSQSGAVKLTAVTNDSGSYALTTVPPGTYDITAAKAGFATAKAMGQVVNLGTQSTINLQLKVGGGTETVQVQVLGTELQTLNSTVGSTIAPEAIDSLPSLGHDASTFVELQPGVSPDGSVAGAVSDQSTFLLDGGNNSSDMDGNNTTYNTTAAFAGDPTGGVAANTTSYDLTGPPSGIMPTPDDSVEEVKVNTANQTADFDNSSGAQVEFVTRRGTNQWHGSAYEYYLDNGFDANTWDNNQYGVPIPQYHYSRFGARAGGFMTPKRWGSPFYIFGFYEGFRYPQSETIERTVPSDNLKKGIVTYNGTSYDMAAVDPRGRGIDPVVAAMWNQYEPEGNDASCGSLAGGKCDGVNELGFKANMSLPMRSNDLVFRMDHDFSTKWHWFTSFRYYKLTQLTTSQYDIGGFFSGDKIGVPASTASRPLQPWYLVTGLTTNISANTTNDFHYSYLRNYWSWSTNNAPPQVSGLGGALEPFGESASSVLAPFNVNTQNIRTRFWDGQDHFLSDNVTMLKGKHLLQFGGQYQRNYDYHQRSDNGGGINFTPTYQLGESSGPGDVDMTGLLDGYPLNTNSERLAQAVLGIVTASQVAYTRSGSSLSLNPPLTHAFDQDTIPFYNAYISDTWHVKPSFTLTYGMGYTLEMPPTEKNGKATVLVDSSDTPVSMVDFLAQRKSAALSGGVYNPQLGFALVHNVGAGLKYPYNPFYGSFSPRVGVAWNPTFSKSTVLRGGYGRIYGRLNGVDLVLVPLLGVGLIQAVQCTQPFMPDSAHPSGYCGTSNPTAANAFRIGVDGSSAPLPTAAATLPQPDFPGVNDIEAAAPEGMDPHFRPNAIDSFDFTVQRQIGQKSLLEVGYIGRLVHHEFQPVNLNAVPYMMSVGGQQFQTAYANLQRALGCDTSEAACGASVPSPYLSNGTTPNPAYATFINGVSAQPFFEAALKANGYCNGNVSGSSVPYSSCTAAVLDQELGNLTTQSVWSLWSDLDSGPFGFPHTMQNTSGQMSSGSALNGSIGYGNYNAMFISFGTRGWHGLTFQNNFTWSKALGTGALVQATSEYTTNDPFNLRAGYGRQAFDRRLVYNAFLVANEPWFTGQSGLLGRVAGGWTLAPIFTMGSGAPVWCGTWTGAQAWGAADGNDFYENEQCVFTSPYKGGHSAHFGVTGSGGVGTETSATPVNMFKDPASVWNQVRPPILGIDTSSSGLGPITGQSYWNVDAQLKKNIKIAESMNFEFSFIAGNLFNHREFFDPSLSLSSPATWGVLNTQNGNPRQMEFGGRVTF